MSSYEVLVTFAAKKENMDRFITSINELSVWMAGRDSLRSLCRFVVEENFSHHTEQTDCEESLTLYTESVYKEEVSYFHDSSYIVVKSESGEIVGSIRILNCDSGACRLPITKIFGSDIIDHAGLLRKYSHIWHIGRFAVNKMYASNSSLFKTLMLIAILPIFQYRNGVMIAETDSHLLRVMRLLGIDAEQITDGKEYLGSFTIPVLIQQSGLQKFLTANLAKYMFRNIYS